MTQLETTVRNLDAGLYLGRHVVADGGRPVTAHGHSLRGQLVMIVDTVEGDAWVRRLTVRPLADSPETFETDFTTHVELEGYAPSILNTVRIAVQTCPGCGWALYPRPLLNSENPYHQPAEWRHMAGAPEACEHPVTGTRVDADSTAALTTLSVAS